MKLKWNKLENYELNNLDYFIDNSIIDGFERPLLKLELVREISNLSFIDLDIQLRDFYEAVILSYDTTGMIDSMNYDLLFTMRAVHKQKHQEYNRMSFIGKSFAWTVFISKNLYKGAKNATIKGARWISDKWGKIYDKFNKVYDNISSKYSNSKQNFKEIK